MIKLQKQYDDWKNASLEAATYNYGKKSTKRNFSNWAELNKKIKKYLLKIFWNLKLKI